MIGRTNFCKLLSKKVIFKDESGELALIVQLLNVNLLENKTNGHNSLVIDKN